MRAEILSAVIVLAAVARVAAQDPTDDVSTPALLAELVSPRLAHSRAVREVRWVDGGRAVVSLGDDDVLARWDSATGYGISRCAVELSSHSRIATHPDISNVILSSPNGDIRSVDRLGVARPVRVAPRRGESISGYWGFEVAMDLSGKYICTDEPGIYDPAAPESSIDEMVIFRLSDLGECARWSSSGTMVPDSTAFSHDGRGVLWIGSGGGVYFARIAGDVNPAKLCDCEPGVRIVDQLTESAWLMYSPRAGRIYVLRVERVNDGRDIGRLQHVRSDLLGVTCVASAGSARIVVGQSCGAVVFASLDTTAADVVAVPRGPAVTAIDFDLGHGATAIGLTDGTIRLLDGKGTPRSFPAVHRAPVESIEVARNGRTFATSDAAGRLVVWSAEGFTVARTLDGLFQPIAVAEDGRAVAACTSRQYAKHDGTDVVVVELDGTDKLVGPFRGASRTPTALAFVPSQERLIIGSWGDRLSPGSNSSVKRDPSLQVIDYRVGAEVYRRDSGSSVWGLGVDGKGQRIVTGGAYSVRTFDAGSGGFLDAMNVMYTTGGAVVGPLDVDFETDRLLIVGFPSYVAWRPKFNSSDGPVAVRDAPGSLPLEDRDHVIGNGHDFKRIVSRLARVRVARWIPGGNFCVLAGAGGAEIFDVRTNECICRWTPHGDDVVAGVVVGGGDAFITAGPDGVVRAWDLRSVLQRGARPRTGK